MNIFTTMKRIQCQAKDLGIRVNLLLIILLLLKEISLTMIDFATLSLPSSIWAGLARQSAGTEG